MIFVSYFTCNTPYEKVMRTHLEPSLQRWGLRYDIKGIENLGSWQENTHYKAKFIKEMLLKHKQSVVFLDADATIEQNPILFTKLADCDIALHFLDWFLLWRKQKGNPKREALSGTLYLNYNKKTLRFLDLWIEENNKNTTWEQRNMQHILETQKKELKIYELPAEYCAIILHNGEIPYYYLKEKPVILHHQVSRKLKNNG